MRFLNNSKSVSLLKILQMCCVALLLFSVVACNDDQPTPNPNEDVGVCGDGVLDLLEECDDGNIASDDGCSADCINEIDPTCDDGIQNQDETDIDCGGDTCDACEVDDTCVDSADCASGDCSDEGICVAVCGNGIIETGEDCDGIQNVGDASCESAGFAAGTLLCDNNCEFDDGECSNEVTFCSDPEQVYDIPDDSVQGVDVPIIVEPMGTIKTLAVNYINITHTWIGDLDVMEIRHENGTTSQILDDASLGCSGNNIEIVIEDAFLAPVMPNDCINANDPALQGLFQPLTALSVFDDAEASGIWTFHVKDLAGGDTGTVNSVCLRIEYE